MLLQKNPSNCFKKNIQNNQDSTITIEEDKLKRLIFNHIMNIYDELAAEIKYILGIYIKFKNKK